MGVDDVRIAPPCSLSPDPHNDVALPPALVAGHHEGASDAEGVRVLVSWDGAVDHADIGVSQYLAIMLDSSMQCRLCCSISPIHLDADGCWCDDLISGRDMSHAAKTEHPGLRGGRREEGRGCGGGAVKILPRLRVHVLGLVSSHHL